MKLPRRAKLFRGALVLLGVIAALVRLWPYFTRRTWLHPTSYDDGVYSAAAQLFARGVMPYRDFDFVHPPMLLLALFPVSVLQLDPARAFVVMRWIISLIGGVNAYLAGRIAGRVGGVGAGLFAAAAYAVYAEATEQERGPYLEPVLNCFCLFALSALSRPGVLGVRRAISSGVLLGLAVATKVWAVVWAASSLLRVRTGAEATRLVLSALVAFAAVVVPFLLLSPQRFLLDVIWMQAGRTPDGELSTWIRLREIWIQNWPVVTLAILSFVAIAFERRRRSVRVLLATGFLLTVVMFLVGRSYWNVYNAFLAPSACVLAGVAVSFIARRIPKPSLRRVAVGLSFFALIPSGFALMPNVRARDLAAPQLGAYLRTLPGDACVVALEPAQLLVGGRLPPSRNGRALVDAYGMQLGASLENGPHQSIHAALQCAPAQAQLRAQLEGCEYLILGWRRDFQMGPELQAWLSTSYERVTPDPGGEVWRRR